MINTFAVSMMISFMMLVVMLIYASVLRVGMAEILKK
jgi:hypothetical protein